MKNNAILLLMVSTILFSISSGAYEESKFQNCVKMKDLTLSIASKADAGSTKEEIKSKLTPEAHPLVDHVFDFRGAFSNNDIAKTQMKACLKAYGIIDSMN